MADGAGQCGAGRGGPGRSGPGRAPGIRDMEPSLAGLAGPLVYEVVMASERLGLSN